VFRGKGCEKEGVSQRGSQNCQHEHKTTTTKVVKEQKKEGERKKKEAKERESRRKEEGLARFGCP